MALLFWIVLVLFSALVEAHTNAFVALFVGVAAAVDVVLALAGVPFWIQAIFWLVFSGLTLWLVRPLALSRLQRNDYDVDLSAPTATALTDRHGVVVDVVGDEQHPGRVRVQSEQWRAVSESGSALAVGTPVIVTRAYGTTLWVAPLRPDATV